MHSNIYVLAPNVELDEEYFQAHIGDYFTERSDSEKHDEVAWLCKAYNCFSYKNGELLFNWKKGEKIIKQALEQVKQLLDDFLNPTVDCGYVNPPKTDTRYDFLLRMISDTIKPRGFYVAFDGYPTDLMTYIASQVSNKQNVSLKVYKVYDYHF